MVPCIMLSLVIISESDPLVPLYQSETTFLSCD